MHSIENAVDIARSMDPLSHVYYVRFCCRVKIGYTTGEVQRRLSAIPHHELLAIEKGGIDLEGYRHRQFAHLRDVGEWFEYGPELQAHVARLRGASPILVDTEAAAAYAGRDIAVIYRWASEGRLTRYGGRGKGGAKWDIRQIPEWKEDSGRPRPSPPKKLSG